jgi:hypothetical protein
VAFRSRSLCLVVFPKTKVKSKCQSNNSEDEYHHKQGPPLELSRTSSRLDALVQLRVGVFGVFIDLDRLVLDVDSLLLLVDDLLVELLEQRCQFNHGLLNALDVVVTSTNGAEYTGRLPAAVALELETFINQCSARQWQGTTYSLCENTLVTPVGIRSLLYLSLGRLWVDDPVLTGNGLTIPLGVVGLFPLEILELALERPLQRLNLGPLERVSGIAGSIALEEFDLVLDLRIPDLCLRYNALELGG